MVKIPAIAVVVLSIAATWIPGCRAVWPRHPASIILITIDTLRADHVNDHLTPALAALSRESIVFDNVFTSAPLTLPAHASLLTGLYPPRHGVHDNHVAALGAEVATFPAHLKQRGYATAAFVSAIVLDHRYGLNRGFEVYDDQIDGPERPAGETLARAERWIGAARRPFFVWVHLFEPHAPYRSGSYAAEVTAADAALAAFFSFLRERKLWDEAALGVTSDHGESLGEHGEQTHGFFVYDATLRIPWILKLPQGRSGHVRRMVRIVDELPTLIDAGAAREPQAAGPAVDGIDLMPFLAGDNAPPLEAYGETFLPRDQFGWSELKSVRTERFKYIDAPEPELYDVSADPGEQRNVVEARAQQAAPLERIVAAIARGAPPAASAPAGSDPALEERLLSLGYIGFSPSGANPAAADPKAKLETYNLIMSALELSEAGDAAGALARLQRAGQRDPEVAQIAFLEGNLLGRIGRYEAAARALERTVALNPQFTAARFKLALALVRLGQADRATAALEHVVRERPDDFRAWHNLAAIAYSQGDLDRAEQLEGKALAVRRDYPEAWNTLGAIYLLRHQPAAAADALNTATRLAPRNAQAFHNLALALQALHRADGARAAAAAACAIETQYCKQP